MSVRNRSVRGVASVIVTGAVVFSFTRDALATSAETSTETSTLLAAPGWSAAASMSHARGQHAAVLLPTGELLVVNGVGPSGRITTAEL